MRQAALFSKIAVAKSGAVIDCRWLVMRTNLGDVGTPDFRWRLALPEITAFPLLWNPAPDFRDFVGCHCLGQMQSCDDGGSIG